MVHNTIKKFHYLLSLLCPHCVTPPPSCSGWTPELAPKNGPEKQQEYHISSLRRRGGVGIQSGNIEQQQEEKEDQIESCLSNKPKIQTNKGSPNVSWPMQHVDQTNACDNLPPLSVSISHRHKVANKRC